jgi:hypothetical protein
MYGARATHAVAGDPGSLQVHVSMPLQFEGNTMGVLTVAKPV